MFVNHIPVEQMKQILQKSILTKSISPTDQSKTLNKRRKLKKKKILLGVLNENKQNAENLQDIKDQTQHIKSQDVSLIKYKPDECEEKIIRDYTLSPQTLELQENTLLKNNGQKQGGKSTKNNEYSQKNNEYSQKNNDQNIKNIEQKCKNSQQNVMTSKIIQKQNGQEPLYSQQISVNSQYASINSEDQQKENKYKSIVQIKNNQKGVDYQQNLTKDIESNLKHNRSIHSIDRDGQVIQKLAIIQFSPYTDRVSKQKIKNALRQAIKSRSIDKQNKQKRLQPIKQSLNSSPTNNLSHQANTSSRTKDEQIYNNTITNNLNPLLKLRPRSSSFKVSTQQNNKLQVYNGQSKLIDKLNQDNLNFYSQNFQRNDQQIPIFKKERLRMSQEERQVNTDYSIFRKNKKLLDDQLYSTQYSSNKKHALSIDLSFQKFESNNQSINVNEEEDINFYKDYNELIKQKQKSKIYRCNSSRKQHEDKINSIEKIYKGKIPQINEPFSPTQKNKHKKKINQIGLKDIQIYQSSQKNNKDNLLPKIQEAQQIKNK